MKKYLILIVLTAFAGITLSCGNSLVPQGAFRIKTRGKVYLNGRSVPLSIPNPNILVKLKTLTPAGTNGTTGTNTEFYPGEEYASTDDSGVFDAVDAVLPAEWNGRIAPNQSRCSSPVSNPFYFSVTDKTTHKVECAWTIYRNFIVEPAAVAVGGGIHPPNFVSAKSLTGILVKSKNGSPYFRRFNELQLKALYYKQIDGEDYELEGEKTVISISDSGENIVIPIPDFRNNEGIVHYRILIKDNSDDSDVYAGHSELDVSYGTLRY